LDEAEILTLCLGEVKDLKPCSWLSDKD
jgi:hypothetical protein